MEVIVGDGSADVVVDDGASLDTGASGTASDSCKFPNLCHTNQLPRTVVDILHCYCSL